MCQTADAGQNILNLLLLCNFFKSYDRSPVHVLFMRVDKFYTL